MTPDDEAEEGLMRRVVLVVMDGLRPDAVGRFDLSTILRVASRGASTMRGRTVRPSVTACAMTSLLTGAAPELHGMQSDRFRVPTPRGALHPMPRLLAKRSLPTSAFMASVGPLMRPFAHQAAGILGIGDARFTGEDCDGIVEAARRTLLAQRRGLIVLHLPDADHAGHAHGWMSYEYGRAAKRLDHALGTVTSLVDLDDPRQLLVLLADHGGGGTRPDHHDSDHPLDQLIPIIFAGGSVEAGLLADPVSLLDVPPTILWTLGVPRPVSYSGRVLSSVLRRLPVAA